MRVGKEIDDLLNEALIDKNTISAKEFQRAHGLFWLWVLGAYELIRTMDEAKVRFSQNAQGVMTSLSEGRQ